MSIDDDDPLPKAICYECSDSLKKAYDFIIRAQDVNEKYLKLLVIDVGDPLQANDGNNPLSDCLEESVIDMPVDQYLGDVKLEVTDQYGIVLLDKISTESTTNYDANNKGKILYM